MRISTQKIAATIPIICLGLFGLSLNVAAQTWNPAMAPITNWQSVACSADGTHLVAAAGGFLGTTKGPIYVSSDSGGSWTPTQAPVTNWLHIASSADGSRLVAVGYFIYYSTDFGGTWTVANAPAPFEFWSSVVSSADGSKWAAGEIGGTVGLPRKLYLSADSGANWAWSGTNGSAVASSADGKKLAALQSGGSSGFIVSSTNSGALWKSNSITGSQLWWALASSADGVKLAAASGGVTINSTGTIYTSTNSGTTWKSNNAPVLKWSAIASSADGVRLVAAAGTNGIYTSIDSGTTWLPNTVPVANWTSVASSADGGSLVAVANGGGLYTLSITITPRLDISNSASNTLFSWTIPSKNFSLQQNSDLSTTNWMTLTNNPGLNFNTLKNQVIIPRSNSIGFFRLAAF